MPLTHTFDQEALSRAVLEPVASENGETYYPLLLCHVCPPPFDPLPALRRHRPIGNHQAQCLTCKNIREYGKPQGR